MRISELDDTEKEALLNVVIDRARADLNDGKPLTEMQTEQRCPDCGSTEAGSCFYCKMD